MRHSAIRLLLFCGVLGGGMADEDHLFPPTYDNGYEYAIRHQQTTMMTLPPSNASRKSSQRSMKLVVDIVARCERTRQHAANRVVTTGISALKMEANYGGTEMSYDSTDDQDSPLTAGFKDLLETPFKFYLNESNHTLHFEGLDEFTAGEGNPLAQHFSADQLKQLMLPSLDFGIGPQGVLLGSEWKHQVDLPLSASESVKAIYLWNYVRDIDLEKSAHAYLEYSAELDMNLLTNGGKADPASALKFKSKEMTGSLTIDKKLRFPRTGKSKVVMNLVMPHPAEPGKTLELPTILEAEFRLLSAKRLGLRLLRKP